MKQVETGYHKQLVITYSLHIHCNNQMQTDWLENALQLNITVITLKEVVNGYDPFSTIFLMLLQKVKVTFILSHLRKPFLSGQIMVSVLIPIFIMYYLKHCCQFVWYIQLEVRVKWQI